MRYQDSCQSLLFLQEAKGLPTAQPNIAHGQIPGRRRRKLTNRKSVNPSMTLQPLASADQADTSTLAQ